LVTNERARVVAKEGQVTIPIVMVTCDALAAGVIDSLARPGGNITGVTCISSVVSAKRLELFRDTLGKVPRVAVLRNPQDPGKVVEWGETQVAARTLGVPLQSLQVRDPGELQPVFGAATTEHA